MLHRNDTIYSQKVFFSDKDKAAYLNLLYKHAQDAGLTFWAYCLMDNHVHLIAVPEKEDSLAKGIGDTHKPEGSGLAFNISQSHKYYTRVVNFRENWRGYLWQGRFSSFPLGGVNRVRSLQLTIRNICQE